MTPASPAPVKTLSGARGRRIRRFCRVMSWVALFFVIAPAVLAVVFWFAADRETFAAAMRVDPRWLDQFTWTDKLAPFLVSLFPALVISWAIWRARTCFDEFALGRLFSRRAILGLRDFAIGMGIGAVASPLTSTILSVLLSWNAPVGQKQMVIAIGSDTILGLVFASTIAIISWVMSEAADVAEENAQFI